MLLRPIRSELQAGRTIESCKEAGIPVGRFPPSNALHKARQATGRNKGGCRYGSGDLRGVNAVYDTCGEFSIMVPDIIHQSACAKPNRVYGIGNPGDEFTYPII